MSLPLPTICEDVNRNKDVAARIYVIESRMSKFNNLNIRNVQKNVELCISWIRIF